ncbi:MAG: nonstructural protein [Microvirus sp.]|nr:MAG: nonstructural protein [Microvirus sp.]
MTKLIICGLWDSAVQAYTRPIFVQAAGQALRSFIDEVNRADKDNNLHNHPEDFELRYLGEWDDETGAFSVGDSHASVLARGKDVINPGGNQP